MTTRALLLALWCVHCGDGATDDTRCGEATGVVDRVIDGDTVELEDGRTVRYLLVDAPELSTPADCYGPEARDANASLVLGSDVKLAYDTDCTDRFDRTLAYVAVGDRVINRVLLERGYARLLVIPPNNKHEADYRAAEADAKGRSAGLWGACE